MPASISRADLAAAFGDKADHGNGADIRIAMSENGFTVWGVSDFNALVLFNVPENATSFTHDAFVEAGRTVTGRIVGPDDKPVTGVMAFGLRASASDYLQKDTFTLSQLNPKETRKLVFLHAKKGLGAVLKVRGDEKGPLTVHLKPCGAATGQFVNADGEPIANLAFECNEYLSGPTPTKTDHNGRFRVECLVPGESYTVTRRISQPVAFFQTCFGPFTVKSGEVKHLGQARIKRDR